MLDPARRFLSLDALKRTLLGMWACRLNVLHLHLSDDQGLRLALLGHTPPWAHYAKSDLCELVEFAADLGIRVLPEIDLPGHATALLALCPQLAKGQAPSAPSKRFGVHQRFVDCEGAHVREAIKAIIAELAEIFPDPCIHLGGDESEGYEQPPDFSSFLVEAAANHGKRVIFWDEALCDDLPRQAIVQAWRHHRLLGTARGQGHAGILSAPYYLDLMFPSEVHHAFDPGADNEAAQQALLASDRLSGVRAGLEWYEAQTANLCADFEAGDDGPLLGGEACLWGELVAEAHLDTRLWSRMPAIADRLWSGAASVLPDRARTDVHLERIAGIRVGPQAWLESLQISAQEREHLGCLLSCLEPVKWYGRLLGPAMLDRIDGRMDEAPRPYSVDSPLDRPVDFVDPESQQAARFQAATDKPPLAAPWRAQLVCIKVLSQRFPQIQEILPLAERLADLAALVDGQLDLEAFRERHPDAEQPVAELTLALVKPVMDWQLRQRHARASSRHRDMPKTETAGDDAWRAFAASHDSHRVTLLPRGHIHQTYLVEADNVAVAVLQKISRSVFHDPEALIANAAAIEPYVRKRVAARMFTRAGRACFIDAEGEYWRAYEYLGPSRNMDLPTSVSQCFAAGEAFGAFQAALRNLPRNKLEVSIEGFQDFAAVVRSFDLAVRSDARRRLASSTTFASKLRALEGWAPMLSGPFGVVHGDCKFNNLLFDAHEDRVIGVLDLDTVMWHRRALDFGDLVRAGAVRGSEDDVNAELDLERTSAFAAGFLAGAGSLAPDAQAFLDALLHVTLMLTLRFYADYLNGDVYFQIDSPGDNLRRAKGQLALFEQVLRRRVEVLQALK